MTIYRILCKSGLNNHPLIKPRKQRKYIRFERKFPNELWQIDLKVIENEGKWLISIFDIIAYLYYIRLNALKVHQIGSSIC